ncbi:MAG: hypothetical protein HZB92_03900 [Euryarchaeota archaeon]|nr:hypothetical protein [Euryarchaeota archaeon]
MRPADPHDIRQKRLLGVDAAMEQWLREHSVQDLRDLVFEMYNMGEDTSEMVRVVNDYESLTNELMAQSRAEAGTDIDIDVFEYMTGTEKAVA